jgi:hypothetical protein
MFRIDNDFAREIQSYTNLEITFLNGAQLFGTTLLNRQAVNRDAAQSHAPAEAAH